MTQETFDQYVDRWNALKASIATRDQALKADKATELEMRRAIASSVGAAQKTGMLREGVNTHALAGGANLKITRKVDRKVDATKVDAARTAFSLCNDVPSDVKFDDIIKPKYDLGLAAYKKLTAESSALQIINDVVTSKDAAPVAEIK